MGFFNFGKPWLRRDYKSVTFKMDVGYIVRHLGRYDYDKVTKSNDWQDAKEKTVASSLAAGKKWSSFPPIKLVLHDKREEFRVEDGISRLRAFSKQKGVDKIYATVRTGDW